MIHPVVEGFAPLAGQQCTVTGTGTVARVAADHLRRLGAAVRAERADRATGGGAAAERTGPPHAARLRAPASSGPAGSPGAAEVLVRWADALPAELVHDETSAQAVCGLMHVHGRRHGRPRALRVDVAATAAAVLATTALLARLHAGECPGERHPALSTGVDRAALTLAAHHLAVGGSDGGPPAAAPGGPPFRSAEGTWFEIEALAAEGWAAFWAALGAPREAARDGWRSFADRFTTAVAPLPRALHAATRRHRWAQLRGRAERCGVSVCAVAPAAPGPPSDPWLLRTGPRPHPLPVPHSSRALSAPAGRSPGAAPAPLAGVVVLEVGRRIQGPLAAHLLRLLGADVVRVEPPGGDPMRGAPPLCGEGSAVWLAFNHGKRAVELDLKQARGREQLAELVRDADVLLHNWAPATALRLGLDSAALHRVNPALVHAHTSGWSDAVPDPPLATDYMVQAHSGLADALRADPAEPPRPTLLTPLDSLGGMLGAQAVVAGLLHRDRTGRGSAVETSLLAAARLLLEPLTGRGAPPRPVRRDPVRDSGGRWTTAPGGPGAVPVTTSLRPSELPAALAAVTTTNADGCVQPPHPWSTAAGRAGRR